MDKRFWVWLTSVPSLVSASGVTNEEQLLLENKVNSIQGKVFINDGTPGGTTIGYQKRITYPDGSMGILQKNLTTGEISFQGINSSGQRVFETSLTPYEANALIGANSSSKMLVGNGAVSQVASKVAQVQNNRLPYKPVLALPVKYPIKSDARMPILYDYANYTKVMVEREAAKRAIIYNPNLNYDENKYLNDYMGKEMPGKVTSRYGDVKTYRYADVVDNNKSTDIPKKFKIKNNIKAQSDGYVMNIGAQNKHLRGESEYEELTKAGTKKSPFAEGITREDLQKIYEDNLEIGDIYEEQLKSGGVRKYKIINLEKKIGEVYNKEENRWEAAFGVKIHYNEKNKEYHMVPHYDGKDRDKK